MSSSAITKLLSGFVIIAALFVCLWQTQVAAQTAGWLRVQLADHHTCSSAGTVQESPAGQGWTPWATDQDGWDPDCMRVRIHSSLPAEVDVRFCVQLQDQGVTGNSECTAWASEGGSWSDWAHDSDNWAIDRARVHIDTRSLPGRQITDLRVGIQTSRATGDVCSQGTSGAEYTPYMSQGGGWSPWVPDANEGSFACARIRLLNVSIVGLSCNFNGNTIPSGGSTGAYHASWVPFGSSCYYETRYCSNGSLSGSYGYSSCSVGAPANCTFNGSTVWHGGSVTAYQSNSVPYGSSCTSQVRSCYNGSLSGSYGYGSCTVQPPPVPTVTVYGTKTGASETSSNITLNASENITNIRWASTNATSCSKVAGPADFAVSGVNSSDASVTSPTAGNSTTFTVSCTGPGGTVQDSIQVSRLSAPTVSLFVTATGQAETGSNVTIDPGDQITLRWTSANATSCNATAGAGFSASGTSGTDLDVTEPGSGSNTTYTVACSGAGGVTADSITVTSTAVPPVFSVSPEDGVEIGDTVTFTWNLNGNDGAGCSFSGPGVPATVSGQSGTFDVVIQGSSEFRFSCLGGYVDVRVDAEPDVFES